RIYIHSSEMFSGVTPCQGSLPRTLRVLSSPARSSPLVLPESSQNIWLMVRFCRAVISEIMSLDLRRSSICTDCHSPKDRGRKLKKVISCLYASNDPPHPQLLRTSGANGKDSHFRGDYLVT
uniref:Uncharacterized protein n=1 Tax=Bubo bubo TaxID=30461 RepID=A0A8C0FXN9_BUBBB